MAGVADGRGSPLTALQTTCIGLSHFAGAHFTRVSAYCGNVSYTAAWNAIDRVRSRLVELAPQYIKMPTGAEKEATARRMEEKFGLPGFAYAVDGMHCRFDGYVRGIPVGPGLPNQQNFVSRKLFKSINALIIGDDRKLIRGIDVDHPGSAHDAKLWRFSLLKPEIEADLRFLLAADSAFPISEVLMKPFSNAEALNDRYVFLQYVPVSYNVPVVLILPDIMKFLIFKTLCFTNSSLI